MSINKGKVTSQLEHCVRWKIHNFVDLPKEATYYLESPLFQLYGCTWCLRLFPSEECGCLDDKGDCVSILKVWLLRLVSTGPDKGCSCIVGLVNRHDEEDEIRCTDGSCERRYPIKEFEFNGQKLFGCRFSVETCLFEDFKSFLEDGALTVFCRLSSEGSGGATISPTATKQGYSSAVSKSLPSNGEETPKNSPSVEKLRSDYKKLLKSGVESDLLFVVSDQEFRAHKALLRIRSAVFDAMFEHERGEESGKVIVDDLAPDAFRDFLDYIYTGSVESFSYENVFGLYAAADKYNAQDLKTEALEYIQRTLTVESFCDVMTLALRHNVGSLMERAHRFFRYNLQRIIVTAKWQTFLRENSTAANELLVKTLVPEHTAE